MHRRVGFWLGLFLHVAMLAAPAPEALSLPAWHTAAIAVLMAVWWVTEALPISATALVPLVLLPLYGVSGIREAAAPYANPVIILMLGGFLIALAMQRWNLHRRIAFNVLARFGKRPDHMVLGFMVATGFMSMWVLNTATALMMLPVALSVADVLAPKDSDDPDSRNFALALLLSVAYAASIGGVGTLVGTAPNGLVAAFMLENYNVDIGFADWLVFGLPFVIVMLPLGWWVLTRWAYPFSLREDARAAEVVVNELRKLGPFSVPEKRVAIVFTIVAVLWLIRKPLQAAFDGFGPVAGLTDASIGIGGALCLFILSAGAGKRERLLDGAALRRVPWDVLVLFGGGISLAVAIASTGLSEWIGLTLSALAGWPLLTLIFALVVIVVFLTELTSNTATTATFLPVLAAIASMAAYDNLYLLVPAAISASCAFMLPVATPPNAIVFASGRIHIPEMIRAGVRMNLVAIPVIALLSYLLVPLLL